jgi:hypothetical protein
LKPIPLIITQTTPFGHKIGSCSHTLGGNHHEACEDLSTLQTDTSEMLQVSDYRVWD